MRISDWSSDVCSSDLDGSRGIAVDDRLRTTRANTYAAGDVTGRDQFVYMAAYGAKIAARNALNGDHLVYDNGAMPGVVFTDPQVASVGLTEGAARTGSEERRAGKEFVSTCRSRGSPYH